MKRFDLKQGMAYTITSPRSVTIFRAAYDFSLLIGNKSVAVFDVQSVISHNKEIENELEISFYDDADIRRANLGEVNIMDAKPGDIWVREVDGSVNRIIRIKSIADDGLTCSLFSQALHDKNDGWLGGDNFMLHAIKDYRLPTQAEIDELVALELSRGMLWNGDSLVRFSLGTHSNYICWKSHKHKSFSVNDLRSGDVIYCEDNRHGFEKRILRFKGISGDDTLSLASQVISDDNSHYYAIDNDCGSTDSFHYKYCENFRCATEDEIDILEVKEGELEGLKVEGICRKDVLASIDGERIIRIYGNFQDDEGYLKCDLISQVAFFGGQTPRFYSGTTGYCLDSLGDYRMATNEEILKLSQYESMYRYWR